MDLNSQEALQDHSSLIQKKGILNLIYQDFYKQILSSKTPKKRRVIELGSGGGFIKRIKKEIITSDVIKGPGIDKVFSATNIPFSRNSVGGFIMLDVFHHIKNPEKGLKEMERCLVKNGKIIMIEPYNSFFSKFIYGNFHHETFDPKANWKIRGKGRMSDANTAMPWIVFVRDREKFQKKFPNLLINKVKPHTPFSYLISGGLSKPQILPTFFYPLIKAFEKIVSPFNNSLGLFVTIEITKK